MKNKYNSCMKLYRVVQKKVYELTKQNLLIKSLNHFKMAYLRREWIKKKSRSKAKNIQSFKLQKKTYNMHNLIIEFKTIFVWLEIKWLKSMERLISYKTY